MSCRRCRTEAPGQSVDQGIVRMVLAQVPQRLDHQSARAPGGGHVLGGGPLQDDFLPADFDLRFVPSVRNTTLAGSLFAQPQQIGGVGAGWLNP